MGSSCLILLVIGALICGIIVLPLFALAGVVSWWLVVGFIVALAFLFILIRSL